MVDFKFFWYFVYNCRFGKQPWQLDHRWPEGSCLVANFKALKTSRVGSWCWAQRSIVRSVSTLVNNDTTYSWIRIYPGGNTKTRIEFPNWKPNLEKQTYVYRLWCFKVERQYRPKALFTSENYSGVLGFIGDSNVVHCMRGERRHWEATGTTTSAIIVKDN